MITAVALAVVCAAMILASGRSSAELVGTGALRKGVLAAVLGTALLGAAIVFECLHPPEPTVETVLAAEGDELALGDVRGGVLALVAEPLEGVKKTGGAADMRLAVSGEADKQLIQVRFQLGVSRSDDGSERQERMMANAVIGSLGAGTRARLTGLSPKGKVTIRAAWRPDRFPLRPALILLSVLALLAALFEGTAPGTWRRTFLTAAIVVVAGLGWLLEGGLTAEEGLWTLWIRVAYSVAAGAVIGTLLPTIVAAVLPSREEPQATEPS